jgi:hypothetical protein
MNETHDRSQADNEYVIRIKGINQHPIHAYKQQEIKLWKFVYNLSDVLAV